MWGAGAAESSANVAPPRSTALARTSPVEATSATREALMRAKPKYRLAIAGAAVAALVLAVPGAAGAAPAPAAAPSGQQSPVIVILRNQHPELNARTAKTQRQNTTRSDQAPLVDRAKR